MQSIGYKKLMLNRQSHITIDAICVNHSTLSEVHCKNKNTEQMLNQVCPSVARGTPYVYIYRRWDPTDRIGSRKEGNIFIRNRTSLAHRFVGSLVIHGCMPPQCRPTIYNSDTEDNLLFMLGSRSVSAWPYNATISLRHFVVAYNNTTLRLGAICPACVAKTLHTEWNSGTSRRSASAILSAAVALHS